jgi:spermidine synthase
MKTSAREIFLFSFLLAFCSLFYELVFAQLLSVCIGGTKIQYLITISLFTSALGLGSLCFNYFREKIETKKLFFRIEVLLTLMGSVGPFFIAWLLEAKTEAGIITSLKVTFSYFFIFVIGFLSGFELPCLFRLLDESHGKIMAWDYLGMLMASILFPFLFLPYLGTAASTLFVANINVIALIWLRPEMKKSIRVLSYVVNLILFCCIVCYRSDLNHILTTFYLESK